jgi:Mesyanzhinovviridae DNA polymerase
VARKTKAGKCVETLPLFVPPSHWVAPNLSELPSWKGQKRVGLDCEFLDEHLKRLGIGSRRGVKMAGYSFAFEDGRKFYIPVRHPEGNVDCEQAMRYYRDQAGSYEGEIVGANLPVELDIAEYEPTGAIRFPLVKAFRDVLVADPLINELHHDGYSLEVVSRRRGFEGKDEDMLRNAAAAYGADLNKPKSWKGIIPKLPAKFVGPYGEEDAYLPLKVLEVQDRLIDEEGIRGAWDIESDLLPVLVKMRQRGVLIDFDQLDRVEAWARKEEAEALDKIRHITGVTIPCGKTMTTAVCVPAFAAVGIQVPMTRDPKTKKLKYSLDAEFMATIDHPVTKLLRYSRQVAKLYGTFAKSIREHATNGRIHCTLKQIVGSNDNNEKSGAAYGRLACSAPNLQQQPARSKFADMWRQIYVAEPGTLWGCLDVKQQEPRWTTHYAALKGLHGAQEAARAYREDVKIDNHDFMASITGLPRKVAKELFLGLCYGEGGAKLSRGLKLPTRWCVRYRESGETQYFETKAQASKARKNYEGEATYHETAGEAGQSVLDQFNERAPYIRELAKLAEKRAKDTGVIKVLGGRKLHFEMDARGGFQFTYKALNRLIQGTSGYQVKLALIKISKEMPEAFIQLQIHDEIDGSFESIGQMKQVSKILENAAGPALVPFLVDIETGPSWGNMRLICGLPDCNETVDKTLEINGVKETFYCPVHAKEHAK